MSSVRKVTELKPEKLCDTMGVKFAMSELALFCFLAYISAANKVMFVMSVMET